MSIVFGNPDKIGCFTAKTLNTAGSRGAVVRLPGGDTVPGSDLSDPYLVLDISFSLEELAQFSKLFNDKMVGYAFGHNPSGSFINVTIAGFNREKDVISDMYGRYEAGRLFSSGEKAAISSGGVNLPLEGYIIGLKSNTESTEADIQVFNLQLAVTGLDSPGETSGGRTRRSPLGGPIGSFNSPGLG